MEAAACSGSQSFKGGGFDDHSVTFLVSSFPRRHQLTGERQAERGRLWWRAGPWLAAAAIAPEDPASDSGKFPDQLAQCSRGLEQGAGLSQGPGCHKPTSMVARANLGALDAQSRLTERTHNIPRSQVPAQDL